LTYSLAVELTGVSKRCTDVTAADYLDLDVKKGEILGLLGPNGSGKSTTLKMFLGIVKADSGSVRARPSRILRVRSPLHK
jgi:ABC-2 type transport system ATP-binding protein